MEGRFKGEGPCVCLWLIHDVRQKPTRHCNDYPPIKKKKSPVPRRPRDGERSWSRWSGAYKLQWGLGAKLALLGSSALGCG